MKKQKIKDNVDYHPQENDTPVRLSRKIFVLKCL